MGNVVRDEYFRWSDEELLAAGAFLYTGGITNGQQLIELLLRKGKVDEAWEVLTSKGTQIVYSLGESRFIINPKTWIMVDNGIVKAVKSA